MEVVDFNEKLMIHEQEYYLRQIIGDHIAVASCNPGREDFSKVCDEEGFEITGDFSTINKIIEWKINQEKEYAYSKGQSNIKKAFKELLGLSMPQRL